MKKEKSNGAGVASLVLGILSIIAFLYLSVIGIIMGIIGIVLAAIQNKKWKNSIATAGLVASIIGTTLSLLVILFFLLFY